MGLDIFEDYDKARAGALADYYRYARDNDLFVTYTIINPQGDRSRQAHDQVDEFMTMRILDRDSQGIVVKGAKMLGTSCLMADEVFVSCIQPLGKGDEPYAVSCVVPMNASGLTIMSRKSYEGAAHSVFDNPLSSRFDENDALLYFNEGAHPVGAGVRGGQSRDVSASISRYTVLSIRGVPGDRASDGEAALSRCGCASNHGGERHCRHPVR
jgi:hypothetical protein